MLLFPFLEKLLLCIAMSHVIDMQPLHSLPCVITMDTAPRAEGSLTQAKNLQIDGEAEPRIDVSLLTMFLMAAA